MATKKSQIGIADDDIFDRIPTINDHVYTVKAIKTIELPSKIRLFDSEAIEVDKVERIKGRENVVLVNAFVKDNDPGLQVSIARKTEYEVGDPIRTKKDTEDLLIKVLRKELESIQDAEEKINQFKNMLKEAVSHIETNGLEYDEEGRTIGLKIIKE